MKLVQSLMILSVLFSFFGAIMMIVKCYDGINIVSCVETCPVACISAHLAFLACKFVMTFSFKLHCDGLWHVEMSQGSGFFGWVEIQRYRTWS